jgi:4a-hydroxytetrahydrobiopterin dehydratase
MNQLAQMPLRPLSKDTAGLSEHEARQILTKLPGWEIPDKDGQLKLEKTYRFEDYLQGATFASQVARAAEAEDHHPAILIEWRKVTVTWWTHVIKGLHQNDFIMAARTERLFNESSPGA